MKFFGTGESDMEQRLGEMIARGREPRIGITVSKATISLRITATANTTAACKQQIEQARKEILGCVAEFHFGDGEDFEQQHAIIELLTRRDQSLMIIELGKLRLWEIGSQQLIMPTVTTAGSRSPTCSNSPHWLTASG